MRIGYRTIKTAIGTAASIFIAEQLGLSFYVAAGTIAILCIQITKMQSLRAAYARMAASLIGLVLCYPFFEWMGYNVLSLMLLILFFIPILVSLKIKEGFVTSCVVILHILQLKQYTWAILGNELGLLGIGVGVALLMNWYMPRIDKELAVYQRKIENNFSTILREFSIYLRCNESTWDGKELLETETLLNQAKSLAIQQVENHLFRNENRFYFYFSMREKQFELLERMMPMVSALNYQVPQGAQIADFLEELSNRIHSGNTAYLFLDKLSVMRKEIDQSPLPQSRDEFEVRATLFYLLHEIEQYLLIKDSFGKEDSAE